MLDVKRRVDVDAGRKKGFDILPALRVHDARCIGVRQLVDQYQLGMRFERCVKIELQQLGAAIFNFAPRQNIEPENERLRLGTNVRLDVADDHIDAFLSDFSRGFEHGVGLAYAGSGAEENLQLAARLLSFFRFDAGEQRFGIGPVVGHRVISPANECRRVARELWRKLIEVSVQF